MVLSHSPCCQINMKFNNSRLSPVTDQVLAWTIFEILKKQQMVVNIEIR